MDETKNSQLQSGLVQPKLYSIQEVAEMCRVSTRTVRGWTLDGSLAHVLLNKRIIRIREMDLEAFIEQHVRPG
jgi:excisionase family DNA binding protein